MEDHRNRDDFSRFLVHLTRDYEGNSARSNLREILRAKRIEARNPHCLFQPKIERIGFSDVLKRQFNTVCFTEAPLNQLRFLTREVVGRRIQLKPYGLVFWKNDRVRPPGPYGPGGRTHRNTDPSRLPDPSIMLISAAY